MISDSVGAGGSNVSQDVITVKRALAANGVTIAQPGSGLMDAATIAAIKAFQKAHAIAPENGLIRPRDRTLTTLWPVAYANPTGHAVRGHDNFGSGAYGASRGNRVHDGTDWITLPPQAVNAPMSGRVSTISYPYRDTQALLGVQIDGSDGALCWVWYVQPGAHIVGTLVRAGQTAIGTAQSLQERYPGITDHVHVRVHRAGGAAVDPATLIR
jgi:peptidoglycan hydrolase-like protein with peptidoglycan-binding domain